MLTRLAASNFRLFAELSLDLTPGINLVVGANAAGKTTVLEAAYTLGRGRSFRGEPRDLAGRAGADWTVSGTWRGDHGGERLGGIGWTAAGGLHARLDRADVPLHELAQALAVEVLEPDSHRLLEDGPAYRRRYLDWGVFHVEHRFFPAWRRYRQALRQRNAALRTGADDMQVHSWEPELAAAGEEVDACRRAQVERLRQAVRSPLRTLLGEAEVSLELARGWSADESLADSLRRHLDGDRQAGLTRQGPHRAELRMIFGDRAARHHVSRGQQKMLIAALLLAQAELVGQATGSRPLLLVDDFPAELGPPFQAALLEALRAYGGQVLLTAIEQAHALESIEKNAVFHVEHGSLRRPLRV
ncbi:MAG TPA: DNA replication/repair protein RecF [Candidatus Binatia bacterium]|nr:DNA replication/repair protein RecF [Candidatus Binatia bacterium]